MGAVNIRRSQAGQKIALATGEQHRVVLDPAAAVRLEVEDAFFHTGSAVFLPTVPLGVAPDSEPRDQEFANDALWSELASAHKRFAETVRNQAFDPDDPDAPPGDDSDAREPGLGVILTALQFLAGHPQHRLLLTGHTDTTGDGASNQALSEARARSVLAVLEGDKAAFVEATHDHHAPEDDAVILAHFAEQRGWDCNPGNASKASAADVRAFQRGFDADMGGSIEVDGVVGDHTRGAYFEVYQDELAEGAGGPDQLATLRSQLRFLDPGKKFLAFGERFPIENPGQDGFRSQRNRRVELLFFAPPDLPNAASPKVGDLIYESKIFEFEVLDRGAIGAGAAGADREEAAVELVDAAAPEAGVGGPSDPLVTEMPALGFADPEDQYAFLEPFDESHPPIGQAIPTEPADPESMLA